MNMKEIAKHQKHHFPTLLVAQGC